SNARCRRPTQLFDQSVVPTAAAESALRAELRVRELEGGLRVVVEAAHQPRLAPEPDAQRLQRLRHALKVRQALLAKGVQNIRQLADRGPVLLLAIQDPQRVHLVPALAIGAHARDAIAER